MMMRIQQRQHRFFYTLWLWLAVVDLWGGGGSSPVITAAQNVTTTSDNNTTNMVGDPTTMAPAPGPTTTTNATTEQPPSCYTTFRDVMAAIREKKPFDFVKYIICPNTVINIGDETGPFTGIFLNGDDALSLRQFTRVYCGDDDGRSSNNCTVVGGKNQVRVDNVNFPGEAKKRMEVKGFTFTGSKEYSIYAIYPEGDLLFEDCIFSDHVFGGIMTASVANQLTPYITFRKCIFENNKLGSSPGLFQITGATVLNITDSVFTNNNFFSETVRNTYVLAADDNTTMITLQNNCFFRNNFETLGLFTVASRTSLVDVKNNFGAQDDANMKCHFIYVEENGGSCVDFDTTVCLIDGVTAPPVQTNIGTTTDGSINSNKSSSSTRRYSVSTMIGRITEQRPTTAAIATTTLLLAWTTTVMSLWVVDLTMTL